MCITVKRVVAFSICCIVLSGCSAQPIPAAELEKTAEIALEPTNRPSPAYIKDEKPDSSESILSLPEAITATEPDILGLLKDRDLYELSAEEIAKKYNAGFAVYDNLYEVPDFYIGNYDARLFIHTKDSQVLQLVASQFVQDKDFLREVYSGLETELGMPDGIYELDNSNEITGAALKEELFADPAHVQAVWKAANYTVAFGVIHGYYDEDHPHELSWYIALYKERLDFSSVRWHLPREECSLHPQNDMESLWKIFLNSNLLSSGADQVIDQLDARPAYGGNGGSSSEPLYYSIEGWQFYNYPVEVSLYGDPISHIVYYMDLGTLSEDEAEKIYAAVFRDIESSAWGEKLNASPSRTASEDDDFNQTIIRCVWHNNEAFDQVVLTFVHREEQWWHNKFIPGTNSITWSALKAKS